MLDLRWLMTLKELLGSYKSGMGTCWKKEVKFKVLNGCHRLISTFKVKTKMTRWWKECFFNGKKWLKSFSNGNILNWVYIKGLNWPEISIFTHIKGQRYRELTRTPCISLSFFATKSRKLRKCLPWLQNRRKIKEPGCALLYPSRAHSSGTANKTCFSSKNWEHAPEGMCICIVPHGRLTW